MKTSKKVFLIIATCLVIGGMIIFTATAATVNFDFTQIGLENAEFLLVDNAYSVSEFEELNLEARNVPIDFAKSLDDKIHVKFYEANGRTNDFTQSKNSIYIRRHNTSAISFANPFSRFENVIIELPANFDVPMNLEIYNGYLNMSDFRFSHSFDVKVQNGRINFENLNISGKSSILCSNRSVSIDNSNFASAEINNTNGDIYLDTCVFDSLKSDSTNGRLSFDNVNGNNFNLKMSNGVINGSLIGKQTDYTINTSIKNGDSNLFNGGNGAKIFTANTTNSKLNIDFLGD
ncbi:MAG: DUF4097 family beta strand repeat-containing protein [Clostridia bacterium]